MKLLNKLGCTLLVILVIAGFLTGCQSSTNDKKIGIIVPLENQSLDEIVTGFTTTLKQLYPNVQFKIANAQDDLNLQRAIISQMKNDNYALIVPIGLVATQMTALTVTNKNIVSLAASYTEQDRRSRPVCNIAVVHDEISPRQIVAFIHAANPQLTQLVLVHSASDKIYADVKVAVAAGKELGITIKPMMAGTLNDLYSVANAIPQNAQGILILKDIMIASGINTLLMTAQNRHIPLIAADQGSVQNGASYGVGVHEKDIGVDGAKLAAAILAGKPPCDLPIVDMTHLTVFINKTLSDPAPIEAAAKSMHYTVEFVTTLGAKK